ncbi:MAG: DUF2087 domain-containing protein [Parcubacteria group bacterium]|nr:DUF2087 domain-containing protein [Parcubacteria group bacterium]
MASAYGSWKLYLRSLCYWKKTWKLIRWDDEYCKKHGQLYEQGKIYTEKEVNELLERFHTFEDPALLRRELYEKGLLGRKHDGSEYWKADNTKQ